MAKLTAVDYDPFSQPTLTPVDYDPFANEVAQASLPIKNEPEMSSYEPSLIDRVKDLFPGNKERALNEVVAKQIADERGISVEDVYKEIGGSRPKINTEGENAVDATALEASKIKRGLSNVPNAIKQGWNMGIGGGARLLGEATIPNPISPSLLSRLQKDNPELAAKLVKRWDEKPIAPELSKYGEKKYKDALDNLAASTPADQSFMEESIVSAGQSVGQALPALGAAALTKNPVIVGPTIFGAQEMARAYGEARQKGLVRDDAVNYAARNGLIEAGTEWLSIGALFKRDPNFMKKFANFMVREVPGENIAEISQSANAILSGVDPSMSVGEFVSTLPELMAKTTMSTILAGGAQSGLMHGAQRLFNKDKKNEDSRNPPNPPNTQPSGGGIPSETGPVLDPDRAREVLARGPKTQEEFIAQAKTDKLQQAAAELDKQPTAMELAFKAAQGKIKGVEANGLDGLPVDQPQQRPMEGQSAPQASVGESQQAQIEGAFFTPTHVTSDNIPVRAYNNEPNAWEAQDGTIIDDDYATPITSAASDELSNEGRRYGLAAQSSQSKEKPIDSRNIEGIASHERPPNVASVAKSQDAGVQQEPVSNPISPTDKQEVGLQPSVPPKDAQTSIEQTLQSYANEYTDKAKYLNRVRGRFGKDVDQGLVDKAWSDKSAPAQPEAQVATSLATESQPAATYAIHPHTNNQILVEGDKDVIRAKLKEAGIETKGILFKSKDSSKPSGLIFPAKHADAVKSALQPQALPPRAETKSSLQSEGKANQLAATDFSGTTSKQYGELEIVRDASQREQAAAKKARPLLNFDKTATGWKQIEHENANGVTLVSYDGKKAIVFRTANERSGAESRRVMVKAHAYAIDNPYEVSSLPKEELEIKPIYSAKPSNPPATNSGETSSSLVVEENTPEPAEQKPSEKEVEKAKQALKEAGVTGKELREAIKDVRKGDLTADEVAESVADVKPPSSDIDRHRAPSSDIDAEKSPINPEKVDAPPGSGKEAGESTRENEPDSFSRTDFKRSKQNKPGLSVQSVEDIVAPFRKKWRSLDIQVVEKESDLPGHERRLNAAIDNLLHAQDAYLSNGNADNAKQVQVAMSALSAIRRGSAAGLHRGETIYLVAANLPNTERVKRILAHEAVGHYSFEEMMGDEIAPILKQIAFMEKAGNKRIIEIAKHVDATQPGLSDSSRAREIIATMAEKGIHNSLMTRIKAAIQRFLRKLGFNIALNDADIASLLRVAELRLSGPITSITGANEAYSRGGETKGDGNNIGSMSRKEGSGDNLTESKPQPESEEDRQWFGDSQVVDSRGKPLVVYRGDSETREHIAPQAGMIWMAENKDYAEIFSGENGSITSLHARIENPFDAAVFGDEEKTLDDWRKLLSDSGIDADAARLVDWAPEYGLYYFYDLLPHAGNNYLNGADNGLISAIQSAGYDGIKMPSEVNEGVSSGRVFVAFNSSQIRAANPNPTQRTQGADDGMFSRSGGDAEQRKAINGFKNLITSVFKNEVDGKKITKEVEESFSWWDATVGTTDHLIEKNLASDDISNDDKAKLLDYRETAEAMEMDKGSILIGSKQAVDAFTDLGKGIKGLAGVLNQQQRSLSKSLYDGTLQNVTWSERYLRDFYKLDDAGVAAYKTIRQYFDSATSEYRARLLERIGVKLNDDGEVVLLDDAIEQDAESLSLLQSLLEAEGDKDAISELKNKIAETKRRIGNAEKRIALGEKLVEEFKAIEGYFPLMRYGRYSVSVRNKSGELIYFGLKESKLDQMKLAADLRQKYGADHAVSTGLMEKNTGETLTMDTRVLAMIERHAEEADEVGARILDEVEQAMLKTFVDQSFKKRMIHRKGIPGYDEDPVRAMASYAWSSANYLSKMRYVPKLDSIYYSLDKVKFPKIREKIARDIEYLKHPGTEFAGVKGMVFFAFMGLNVKSAVVNLTQIPMTLYPYLGTLYGDTKAVLAIKRAFAAVNPGKNAFEGEFGKYMKWAEESNLTADQYVGELFGMAQGKRAALAKKQSKLIEAGTMMFSAAEKWNRRTAVASVYFLTEKMTLDQVNALLAKVNRPAESNKTAAVKELMRLTVDKTQFAYAKWNRGRWFRKAGGIPLQFQQFLVNYIQFLGKNGAGMGSMVRSLAILFLVAGAMGLPGAEDLKALLEFLAQKGALKPLGINGFVDIELEGRKALIEMTEDFMGREDAVRFAEYVLRGHGAYSPWDISGSLGSGRIIPGWKEFFETSASDGYLSGLGMAAKDIAGPGPGIVYKMTKGFDQANISGNTADYFKAAIPVTAIQNMFRAIQQHTEGVERDYTGRVKISFEPTMIEKVGQFFSFTPSERNKLYRIKDADYREAKFLEMAHERLIVPYAAALADNDKDRMREAMESIEQWNREAPFEWRLSPVKFRSSLKRRAMGMRSNAITDLGDDSRQLRGKFIENREYYP